MALKIVLSKKSKNDDFGFLQIQHINNGRKIKKSLGIKVDEDDFKKYWSVEYQKFSTKYKKSEEINELIEILKYKYLHNIDFKVIDDTIHIKNIIENDNSFIKYFENHIETKTTTGNKIYLRNVFNKLKNYMRYINKTDILFSDVNKNFIQMFVNYCMTVNDPKKLNRQSMRSYLNGVKVVYNNIIENELYAFKGKPFKDLSYPNSIKRIKKPLTEKQIENLIELSDSDKLNKELKLTLKMFLFQIMSNGMRVSDLLFLRFSNLNKNKLNYIMMKTQKEMEVVVSLNHYILLNEAYGININNLPQHEIVGRIILLKNQLKDKYLFLDEFNPKMTKHFYHLQQGERFDEETYKQYQILRNLYNLRLRKISRIYNKTYNPYSEDFKISDIFRENDKSIIYDAENDIHLSSHISRHTYASILVQNNTNLNIIKHKLNHQNLTQTENYTKQITLDKVKRDETNELIDKIINLKKN